MRTVALMISVMFVVCGAVRADDPRTTLGDIPRTYSHYLNAQEAALCRANAGAGGLSAYFLNPACIAEVAGVAGQATARFNVKNRDYLSDSGDYLDAADDGFLFAQAVAVKRSGEVVFGFGYSAPAYRSVEYTGFQYHEGSLEAYEGDFTGGLRFFEVLTATTIGSHGQGAVGLAAGIVGLNEDASESVPVGQSLERATIDGMAASVAVGLTFDPTDRIRLGLGYRWGSRIDVDGEWYREQRQGESETEPVTVAGVRYRASDAITCYASYVQEGWDRVKSTLAAYPEDEGGLDWDPFTKSIGTLAVGGEVALMNGRVVVRAGASKQIRDDICTAIVPASAVGFGVVVGFDQYLVEGSVVREVFAEDGVSGRVVNYGLYGTVGYAF